MSLLKHKEMTTWIEKDAMDNKRMQLEMKKTATNSSSSVMLMVTRDLMCAEVVVEEQQTHTSIRSKRTKEDQSTMLLRNFILPKLLSMKIIISQLISQLN